VKVAGEEDDMTDHYLSPWVASFHSFTESMAPDPDLMVSTQSL
jgi:hypothetical protein